MLAKHRKMRKLFVMIIVAVLISSLSFAEQAPRLNKTVAIVNGEVITQADFDKAMNSAYLRLSRMSKRPSPSHLQEIRKGILETLIGRELLLQESEKKGVTVSEKEIEAKIEDMKGRLPGEEEFKKTLAQMGVSEAMLRSRIKEGLTVQKIIEQEVGAGIIIHDTDAEKFYNQNKDSFKEHEKLHVSHILINVDPKADKDKKKEARKKIEQVQKKLKEGGDFAILAKEFSDCPSASEGGDIGFFVPGDTVKPFEDAAMALKPGEISDIVETDFGYHIIKLMERVPETIMSFEQAKDEIKKYLKDQQIKKKTNSYIEKLKKTAKIERFLPAQE